MVVVFEQLDGLVNCDVGYAEPLLQSWILESVGEFLQGEDDMGHGPSLAEYTKNFGGNVLIRRFDRAKPMWNLSPIDLFVGFFFR